MRNLRPAVRTKAIHIANALLDEGYDEGRAIRIAIAKAKEWAARRTRNEDGVGFISLAVTLLLLAIAKESAAATGFTGIGGVKLHQAIEPYARVAAADGTSA
jgi:hypothetical protein